MLFEDKFDADSEATWGAFDRAVERRAETRPQLAEKLRFALWALAERGCDDQAARMIRSALADLERAAD